MNNQALIVRRSEASLESVCARLPEAAQRNKFGVLGVHDLKQKMQDKGVDFARECRVFEVCNPEQAKAVLSRSIEISTALPCRIAVYQEDGKTVLATIKPTTLLNLFDAPEARSVAQEVEATTIKIMEEAAAG